MTNYMEPKEKSDNPKGQEMQEAGRLEHYDEDFGVEDDDQGMYGEDDYDPMDGYGTSGEKYGWYNGWSDDVIDDAFEGDPENTWNVD